MLIKEKETFKIKPLNVKTPDGSKIVDTITFNGYEPTLHMVFINDTGDTYELDCTFNHSFRTVEGEWITAEYIEPHHKFDNGYALSYSLVNTKEVPTFDITVPEENCYILESGIVSHNTALIMGGISEGINPDPAMTFVQSTAAGEVDRMNSVLLEIMKSKGVYNKRNVEEITKKQGSVQHVKWLTDEEKAVFKTAFEINQKAIVRLASARGRYIDQWQSLNLFFSAEESPEWIAEVHAEAFRDPNILGLYYIYTASGVQAAQDSECVACQ